LEGCITLAVSIALLQGFWARKFSLALRGFGWE